MPRPFPTLDAIRTGGKPALARALSLIETAEGDIRLAALLDAANADPRGLVLGLTGPPGVGKSTLVNALIQRARGHNRSVGVIAVDPSSQISGGALLGDRTRLKTDPEDDGIFIRSMAARDRLGGLSDHAVAATVLMRAVQDLVIVESVGVGQSEGDIAHVADRVLLLLQPGSGDSLQFMKAGIMELPDLIAVTKADMGPAARRAQADAEGALSLSPLAGMSGTARVFLISATSGEGLDELVAALEPDTLPAAIAALAARRNRQHQHWVADRIRRLFGSVGLRAIDPARELGDAGGPFCAMLAIEQRLRARLLT